MSWTGKKSDTMLRMHHSIPRFYAVPVLFWHGFRGASRRKENCRQAGGEDDGCLENRQFVPIFRENRLHVQSAKDRYLPKEVVICDLKN